MTGTVNQIPVAGIIESTAALTPSAGDKLFAATNSSLQQKITTQIDFDSIEYLTSAFLNAAIGQLYAHYTSEYLRSYLSIINLQKNDVVLLSKVIERAKEYFQNKEAMDSAISNVLSD